MWVLMFVIAWNLARSFGKTYCVQKCKKNGYWEFDFSGTLTVMFFFPGNYFFSSYVLYTCFDKHLDCKFNVQINTEAHHLLIKIT